MGPRNSRKTRKVTGPQPGSAPPVGQPNRFSAFRVFRGAPTLGPRVPAVSFRLHLSAPSATSGVNSGWFGMAFGGLIVGMVRGWRPRLHRPILIRVHTCPSVVVPSRSCSETPIGLVLNRRPGSSGRLNARFLMPVILKSAVKIALHFGMVLLPRFPRVPMTTSSRFVPLVCLVVSSPSSGPARSRLPFTARPVFFPHPTTL